MIIISLVGAGVWRVLMLFPAMTKGICVAAAGGRFYGGWTTSAANRRGPSTLLWWIFALEASIVCFIWARVVPPRVEKTARPQYYVLILKLKQISIPELRLMNQTLT